MDPLSVTASTVGITTLALQSCKAVYQLVDGLKEAPEAIAHSKKLLSETQSTLEGLNDTLNSEYKDNTVLSSVLQRIKLDVAISSTQRVCVEFGKTIKGSTRHSSDSRFSNRDRLAVSFHESKITRLCQQLGECQGTISLALISINLQVLCSMTLFYQLNFDRIVSSRTSEDILVLDRRFTAQEAALAGLEKQLRERQVALQAVSLDVLGDGDEVGESWSAAERDSSVEQISKLQEVCEETLSTTREKRTRQTFGDMNVDKSMAYQGIVGTTSVGVEQSFGKLTATNGSTAAQGQMDAASFAMMFGRR